jgi:hypothetical protein
MKACCISIRRSLIYIIMICLIMIRINRDWINIMLLKKIKRSRVSKLYLLDKALISILMVLLIELNIK